MKTFEELLNNEKETSEIGELIEAQVIGKDRISVKLDAGLKSICLVPVEQFAPQELEELAIGDLCKVIIESFDDGLGTSRLSREKARKKEAAEIIQRAYEEGSILEGLVKQKIRGGFHVDFGGLRAFLPGSLTDVRPVRELESLEGQVIQFKVLKIDPEFNNILISRKAVIEMQTLGEKNKLIEDLIAKGTIKGVVKNITNYGAFVDLGSVDGLVHITDLSWKRINHPSEVLSVGDEVEVKVLNSEPDTGRVSLGMKQLGLDPWEHIGELEVGKNYSVKVTKITSYGCFAEFPNGIEGLIHSSEMSWINKKSVKPANVVEVGQEIQVQLLDVDKELRRVSMGLKQCLLNPWSEFAKNHAIGDKLQGEIRSITNFGVFIMLENSLDGLVHTTDIAWGSPSKTLETLKKGDSVEVVVLNIDVEKERISLGMKQLQPNYFNDYIQKHKLGSLVIGKVKSVNKKIVRILLDENEVEAFVRASELSESELAEVKVGSEVKIKLILMDSNKRIINASLKDLSEGVDAAEEPIERLQPAAKETLGNLVQSEIKKSMEQKTKEPSSEVEEEQQAGAEEVKAEETKLEAEKPKTDSSE